LGGGIALPFPVKARKKKGDNGAIRKKRGQKEGGHDSPGGEKNGAHRKVNQKGKQHVQERSKKEGREGL